MPVFWVSAVAALLVLNFWISGMLNLLMLHHLFIATAAIDAVAASDGVAGKDDDSCRFCWCWCCCSFLFSSQAWPQNANLSGPLQLTPTCLSVLRQLLLLPLPVLLLLRMPAATTYYAPLPNKLLPAPLLLGHHTLTLNRCRCWCPPNRNPNPNPIPQLL